MLVEVEIDLRDRHESERQHQIVDVGDHRAERELPLETEPQIDKNARRWRQNRPIRPSGEQFARYARTNDLDATIFDGVPERATHLLDRLLLRCFTTGLLGKADQHVGRAAKLLKLHLAETERC